MGNFKTRKSLNHVLTFSSQVPIAKTLDSGVVRCINTENK